MAAVLIPSIDLQGGAVVQLVRGEKTALSFDDPGPWIQRFAGFPRVQLIDLDAARGTGNNRVLVTQIAQKLPVQVGGGIRTPADAQQMIDAGAQAVIIGSALYREHASDPIARDAAESFARTVALDKLIFGVDCAGGRVAIRGWRHTVAVTAAEAVRQLDAWCGAFLYTHIDVEGTMAGFPIDEAAALRGATQRRLICAGGIRSWQEIDALEALGADAVVGMAVYRDLLPLVRPEPEEER